MLVDGDQAEAARRERVAEDRIDPRRDAGRAAVRLGEDEVAGLGVGEASIQEFGGPRSYQIRLPRPEGGEGAANLAASRIQGLIAKRYPGARVDAVEVTDLPPRGERTFRVR